MADIEELKQKVLEFATKKAKFKSKMYIKDLYKADPDAKPRDIKKAANALVQEEKLEFFSSGSTTMYGVPGFGKSETDQFGEEKD
jgi:DNA replication protein DnaC